MAMAPQPSPRAAARAQPMSPPAPPCTLPRWVVVVSGRRGAGKDFLAGVVAEEARAAAGGGLRACVRSISESTKRRYASATGASAELLLGDSPRARAYKEEHRQRLDDFHQQQVAMHGRELLLQSFLDTVRSAAAAGGCTSGPQSAAAAGCAASGQSPAGGDAGAGGGGDGTSGGTSVSGDGVCGGVELLLVSGLREPEQLTLPQRCRHLLPGTQVLTVLVVASEAAKERRHDWQENPVVDASEAALEAAPRSAWGAVFVNEADGEQAARAWAREVLLPLLREGEAASAKAASSNLEASLTELPTEDEGLLVERLRTLVPCVPDYPRPGIVFRAVLHLEADGLALAVELLAARLRRLLSKRCSGSSVGAGIDAVVGIEAGGLVFAAPLAALLGVPLVPLRKRRGASASAGGDSGSGAATAAANAMPPPVLVSPPYGGSFIRQQAAQGGEGCNERRFQEDSGYAIAPDHASHHYYQLEAWGPSLHGGQRVVVVDDLLASGATLAAAVTLCRQGFCAEVVAAAVAVELPVHGGRAILDAQGVWLEALLQFEGV